MIHQRLRAADEQEDLGMTYLPQQMTVWLGGVAVHDSHKLMVYRGLFVCRFCGAMGSSKLRLLRAPCAHAFITSGRRTIQRVRSGLLPWGLTHWPDQVQNLGRRIALASLGVCFYDSSSGGYSVARHDDAVVVTPKEPTAAAVQLIL